VTDTPVLSLPLKHICIEDPANPYEICDDLAEPEKLSSCSLSFIPAVSHQYFHCNMNIGLLHTCYVRTILILLLTLYLFSVEHKHS